MASTSASRRTVRARSRCADSFKPDVAVLDIGLPVMDGYELARHLRHRQPELRIVALTGYGAPRNAGDVHSDAFKARLLKPVEMPALLAAIAPDIAGGSA